MSFLRLACLLSIGSMVGSAQMTRAQKAADFAQLAAVYAMNYGPAQWKRDALQVDLLAIDGWLSRASDTGDDLDFYEVCVAYVASLNDAHDTFLLPSDFEASLGFAADLYEGRVLIDAIDRSRLTEAEYPFRVGDELISMDGTPVRDLLQRFSNYAISGNPLSTARVAAEFLTYRVQALMPHAHEIGSAANVLMQSQDGNLQTYSIPWKKSGAPITLVGPVISPSAGIPRTALGDTAGPRPLARMRDMRLRFPRLVRGFGVRRPVFDLPPGFQARLGMNLFDFFYSGTFEAQGLKIGYVRIPSFDGSDYDTQDFQNEIAFQEGHTDGLVLDIMRNPGGNACFAEDLLKRVNASPFRTAGLEIRATRSWVADFLRALEDAVASGENTATIEQLQTNLSAVEQAFHQPSGRTGPLAVCSPSLDLNPAVNKTGQRAAYTKPIMLLTDEFTASAADLFAAVMQDNERSLLFGNRTMGAGGSVNLYGVTTYSEGTAYVTESLMSRKQPISTPGFPATSYVENVGVRPDILVDYMTVDNLMNNGSTFVKAFTGAIVQHILTTHRN